MGSVWTGIWNEGDAGPAPGSFISESLSTLIPAEAQGYEWLPLCTQMGLLELAPTGDVTTEARRVRALAARNCSCSSRGEGPYWDDNTLKLAARVHCIPEFSFGYKIYRVSMDSYDHLNCECPGGDLRRARDLGIAAVKNSGSGLPPGERDQAGLLLELYEEPSGYRMAPGDLTRRQKFRLRVAYSGLERPSDREADATFIRQIHQLNTLRESIWEKRRHTLDPAARWWFVVY